ncbi:MAG: calcium/sodium antiporter, partial [Acholeplasmatales bacterium]|nr:calcium/sodium antiporter [Acholeplasmatales bacterium]
MEPELIESWPDWLQPIAFIVALVIGVFCLVKFCDIFVDGASSLAKKAHIPPLIIGLTIVSIGTSCPELAVSVSDSISCLRNGGNAEIAIGNVLGSNICNLLIVLGFSCVFVPMIVRKTVIKRDFPILLFVTGLLILFGLLFGLKNITGDYAILRWEGIILVLCAIFYVVLLIVDAKRNPEQEVEESDIKDMPVWEIILFIVIGAAGVVLGGVLVVFGAKGLAYKGASALDLDEELVKSLVGLTIVAVGTSLPELVTSVVAAKKGQNEMALGNVIGSNIFNIVLILGISGTVNPLVTGSTIV